MSDAAGEPNELHPNGTERTAETCSIKEAAQILQIGERAVLKRIGEGKISAYREGREWRLHLPLGTISEPNRTGTNQPTGRTERTNRTHTVPAENEPHPLAALVQHQSEEIAFLRTELTAQREEHAQSEAELRRLMMADKTELQELRRKVALLAAPPVEVDVEPQHEPAAEPLPVATGDMHSEGNGMVVEIPIETPEVQQEDLTTKEDLKQTQESIKSGVQQLSRRFWQFWKR